MNGHVKDEGVGVGGGGGGGGTGGGGGGGVGAAGGGPVVTAVAGAGGVPGGGGVDDDNICRDFLRNVCRRGKRCKYRHPDDVEPGGGGGGTGGGGPQGLMQFKADLTFCHDYQNGHCSRPLCR